MRKLAFVALFGASLVTSLIQTAQAQAPTPAVPEAMPFDIP
jgi:hypothetical protein